MKLTINTPTLPKLFGCFTFVGNYPHWIAASSMSSKNEDEPTNSSTFNAILHPRFSTGQSTGQLRVMYHKMRCLLMDELNYLGCFPLFLQLIVMHSQLSIIMGLCMDGSKSLTSKILRTRLMQLLGKISFTLYLTHWPVIDYIILAFNGKQEYIDGMSETNNIYIPIYGSIIALILAPFVAYVIRNIYEKPLAKLLTANA